MCEDLNDQMVRERAQVHVGQACCNLPFVHLVLILAHLMEVDGKRYCDAAPN